MKLKSSASLLQRILNFRGIQTIDELNTAIDYSGIRCIFCHRLTKLHWTHLRTQLNGKEIGKDTQPETERMCLTCHTECFEKLLAGFEEETQGYLLTSRKLVGKDHRPEAEERIYPYY